MASVVDDAEREERVRRGLICSVVLPRETADDPTFDTDAFLVAQFDDVARSRGTARVGQVEWTRHDFPPETARYEGIGTVEVDA